MGAVLPLLALRAFTEAARLGSLKAAAERMGVTPGAVSQQVRLLEARMGVVLFVRGRHGVHLSEAGARVYPGLLKGFDQIEASLALLEQLAPGKTLTISTVPSFAASWLVPRLGRFNALHPQIEVRVEASAKLVDFQRERIDVALRHGLGQYPGLASIRLLAPVLLPVASPQLLAQGPALKRPADCLKYPLLHDADRADWMLWLQAHGVADEPRAARGASFEDDLLLLRAAAAGQGIALVQDTHAAEDLASGRLQLALDKPWPARFAYYLVCRQEALQRPEVQAFADWVRAEADARS
ncbi:Glycine cleavage system transcriptional activator [compost metagenome]|uniref:Glycine cleavage system transcriptional activator n=1 Tax=Pseudomonas wadenswilerensis TaxID=1785161 RepID=A0A380T4P7_9PSED|nr:MULTISPECIES: LysR substrate-binding domain-containing protein [Pseudomonas]MCE5982411.1 LysR substrate-binding domain-containing protein [Pseudomonas sp. LF19]UVM23373.1 LysR substrate-binding domain-containing protein [Pseudomonas wadenswilerensis]SUQ64570.1 Glycine cleavage system transcriptional activator [Pseudomonas wadenswilerensis]